MQRLEACQKNSIRRDLCSKEIPSLICFCVRNIVQKIEITASVIDMLPFHLYANLAREAVVLGLEEQVKQIMRFWPKKTFDLEKIALACCSNCKSEFYVCPHQRMATASNAFTSLITECEPQHLRFYDQSTTQMCIDHLMQIEKLRKNMETGMPGKYKIFIHFVVIKPDDGESSGQKEIFKSLQKVLETNKNSPIEIVFTRLQLENINTDQMLSFLRNLNPNLKHLYAPRLQLKSEFEEFISIIDRFKDLVTLDIEAVSNNITMSRARQLGDFLADKTYLQVLDLSNNPVGGLVRHILTDAPEEISILDLSNTNIQTEDLLFIANIRTFTPKLTHLSFNDNDLSQVNYNIFYFFMTKVKASLATLLLKQTNLNHKNMVNIIALFFESPNVNELDISYNAYTTDELKEMILSAIDCPNIRHLAFSWPSDLQPYEKDKFIEDLYKFIECAIDKGREINIIIIGDFGRHEFKF